MASWSRLARWPAAGVNIERLVVGGGANSLRLAQLLADLSDLPGPAPVSRRACPLRAAGLEGNGAGAISGVRDVSGPLLGIDIGGTTLAVVVATPDGRVIAEARAASRAEDGPDAMIDCGLDMARRVVVEAGIGMPEVEAVGIGCGGPLDPWRGVASTRFPTPAGSGSRSSSASPAPWAGRHTSTTTPTPPDWASTNSGPDAALRT